MKRILHILLPAVCCLLTFACSRDVEETPLYQKYAMRNDLTVAQVTGFQLNDSVKTDVVIIVADDNVAWQGLKEELDIRTTEGVTSWMGDIDKPAKRTIAFYRIDTEEQRDALLDYQLSNIVK